MPQANRVTGPTVNPLFVESTDGVQVAVHDFGGDGPLLVLSHATGFCGGAWLPMAQHLTDRFRVVALDYRGHGHTVTPEATGMEWIGMGHDLLAVLDAFSPDRPVFVAGHSMGGAAIILAESIRPGRVAKGWGFEPILFDPDLEASTPSDQPSAMVEAARRRRASFESREAVYERYSSRPPLELLDPRALRAYVDFGFRDLDPDDPAAGVTLRCTPEREAETFGSSHSGAFAAAATISFDYRVLVSGDGMPPALMAERAATVHPRMSLARYPDLTHFGPLEAPERVADDAAAWFLV